MAIRKVEPCELSRVLEIYGIAREFMKKEGNPTQWGDDYPSVELVKSDMAGGKLYVLEEEGHIYGVFSLFEEGDSDYNYIEGKWLNDLPYAAVHRVASSGERKGVLGECIDFCLGVSKNLKMDTHFQNIPMQAALKKQGFVHCGTIYIDTGEPFMAFQLSVS